MNFSIAQIAIVVLVPVLLNLLVWYLSRRPPVLAVAAFSFLLGAIIVWPVIRVGNLITPASSGLAGHFYLDELINVFLATALPEEIGKGLAALLVIGFVAASKSASPLVWIACGAAAHGGFAALEGLFSSLGNEGALKVLVGPLGSLSHIAPGIIMAWFLWRGWATRRYRWANWAAAFLIPATLHTLFNASLVEIPGVANLPDDAPPPPAALLLMLSGLAAEIISIAAAIACLIHARQIVRPVPSTHSRIETEMEVSAENSSAA